MSGGRDVGEKSAGVEAVWKGCTPLSTLLNLLSGAVVAVFVAFGGKV
jgi:hypothetical protein